MLLPSNIHAYTENVLVYARQQLINYVQLSQIMLLPSYTCIH